MAFDTSAVSFEKRRTTISAGWSGFGRRHDRADGRAERTDVEMQRGRPGRWLRTSRSECGRATSSEWAGMCFARLP
jgi:hypothetical protein